MRRSLALFVLLAAAACRCEEAPPIAPTAEAPSTTAAADVSPIAATQGERLEFATRRRAWGVGDGRAEIWVGG